MVRNKVSIFDWRRQASVSVLPPPQEIDRHAKQYEHQSRPRESGFIAQQKGQDAARAQNVDERHHRVAPGFVGPFQSGFPDAPAPPTPATTATTESSCANVQYSTNCSIGPRKGQDAGPGCLQPQGPGRGPVAVELSGAANEEPIFAHGLIDAGRGEGSPVHVPEHGDHDGAGHE